jgi:hypothetical protein
MFASCVRTVAHAKIFERELALSIAQRATATKAGQLLVGDWRRFGADDLVLGIARRAAEWVGGGIGHGRGKTAHNKPPNLSHLNQIHGGIALVTDLQACAITRSRPLSTVPR